MSQSKYSVIHKDGSETEYKWSQTKRKFIMSQTTVIYSNGSQECERLSMLLESLGGEFHKYELGIHFSDRQFRAEFGSEATYPQCAIGDKHIGSMKETLQHLKEKGLF